MRPPTSASSTKTGLILFILMLTMLSEGLDLVVASFIFPRVIEDWGASMESVTLVVTLGVVATALGGYVAGPLADRLGCRPVIIASVVSFAALTMAMALSPDMTTLTVIRVLGCIALGATVPVVIAQVSELVTDHGQSHMVSLVWSGAAFGFILGSVLAATLIPLIGWQGLSLVSGGLTLILVPFLVRFLPRSQKYGVGTATAGPDSASEPPESEPPQSSVRTILSRAFLGSTVLMWSCFAVGLGVAYLIATYLPLMVERYGVGVTGSSLVTGLFGLCGLSGQVGLGFALRRWDPRSVLAVVWIVGTIGIVLLSVFDLGFAGFLVTVCAVAATIAGSNAILPTLATSLYPERVRATGVSWANGAGQIGRLGGGWVGGAMLGAGFTTTQLFMGIAAPTALGILFAILLRRQKQSSIEPAGSLGSADGTDSLEHAVPEDRLTHEGRN